MRKKIKVNNSSLNFFFCPASDYLNQQNETGSHGQLSYNFLKHLAMKPIVKSIFAGVMLTLSVEPIPKTHIEPLLHKSKGATLNDFDSLNFYLISFLKFFRSDIYHNADIVHQIIPFKFGRSFNLFFIFKDKKKKYIIGPIVSQHANDQMSDDEAYVFTERKSFQKKLSEETFKATKKILLNLFGSVLFQCSLMTLQNADILIFSDNYSLSQHKKYIKKNQKTVILDTGIDVSVFKRQNKRTIKRKNSALQVLFVGRLTKRKGCEYLIRAISEAKLAKKDIKIHLTILGYGPLKEKLVTLSKELEVTKNITFLKATKNEKIVSQYYATDIICVPALSDTFTVIKEGMASGKPVITTDVCSHPERVKSGINGFIVPPKDSKAIADVFIKIVKNPKLLDKLSLNTPKTSYLYDWNNILDRYVEIIQ